MSNCSKQLVLPADVKCSNEEIAADGKGISGPQGSNLGFRLVVGSIDPQDRNTGVDNESSILQRSRMPC